MAVNQLLNKIKDTGELRLDYDSMTFVFTREGRSMRLTTLLDDVRVNHRDYVPLDSMVGVAIQMAGCIEFQSDLPPRSVESIVADLKTLLSGDTGE